MDVAKFSIYGVVPSISATAIVVSYLAPPNHRLQIYCSSKIAAVECKIRTKRIRFA
jgi:hypothetical protein